MEEVFLSFVPRRVRGREGYEIFSGSLLYLDISGFTPMSEKLMELGREGSEELTRIINGFFSPLIEIISENGGDIYRFGGDAIIAMFEEPESAVQSAKDSLDFVKKHRKVETDVGRFTIRIHAGVSTGRIFWADLGSDYFLGGKTAERVMKLVERAGPGEIVVDSGTRSRVEGSYEQVGRGEWKIKKVKRKGKRGIIPEEKIEGVEQYIPGWLMKRIKARPVFDEKDGEHRKATAGFIHFYGVPFDKSPEKAYEILRTFYSVLVETLGKYDGWLNKLDLYHNASRALVVFGFPKMHEDDERRAVLFAHELFSHPEIKKLKIKAGLNAGRVFAAPVGSGTRREYTVMGDAVNTAARLASLAPENGVLVSESIFNRTFTWFEYEGIGEREFKGKREKMLAYLLRRKKEERVSLTRWISETEQMVGREKEMEIFRKIVEKVLEGKGQVLGITGDPGIGKSRFTRECVKELKKKGFEVYEGDCLSYGRTFSYYPWIDILSSFLSLSSDAPPKEKAKRLKESLPGKLKKWAPLLGEMMGIPVKETNLTRYLAPKLRKQKLFEAVFSLLSSRKNPVCLVIEDIHWIDSLSLELINFIAGNLSDKKILLMPVFRPIEDEEFKRLPYYTEIYLKELSRRETVKLVSSLLNIKAIPPGFKKLIFEKSQGNPFYTEEIVKSMIEQGFVVEDEKGGWKIAGDVKNLLLPDTVEGVILSRIDRLEFYEKDVLQMASVLGREFEFPLLEGLYPRKEVLDSALESLERLDLIKREKEKGKIKLFFKHILTQEVAYGTLSYARRRELHRRVGIFIEEKMKDRKEEFLGLLSYHFYKGRDYEKALVYSVEAGERAKSVYANEEAIEYFTRAIEAYEKLEGKK